MSCQNDLTVDQIKQKITDYANGYGIDPGLALAQAQRESGFNPCAVGAAGERGLMQFTEATWATYGQGSFDNAFDVDYNLTAWGNYLSTLLGMFGGDYSQALQGYNGGPGHVQNGTVSTAAQGYAQAILSQAGVVSSSSAGTSSTSGFPVWLLIGGAVLLGVFLLRD